MQLTFELEDVQSEDAKELICELSEELKMITGDDGRGSFDYSDMDHKRSVFVVVRDHGIPVGCGAFREISDDTAELKRMYTRTKSMGIGTSLLHYLENKAMEYCYKRIILSTRSCNTKAVQFYLRNGYYRIESYGSYHNKSESVCLEKILK